MQSDRNNFCGDVVVLDSVNIASMDEDSILDQVALIFIMLFVLMIIYEYAYYIVDIIFIINTYINHIYI